jgi:hypothetical protein
MGLVKDTLARFFIKYLEHKFKERVCNKENKGRLSRHVNHGSLVHRL